MKRKKTQLQRFLEEEGIRVSKILQITGIRGGTFYAYFSGAPVKGATRYAIRKAIETVLNRPVAEAELWPEPPMKTIELAEENKGEEHEHES